MSTRKVSKGKSKVSKKTQKNKDIDYIVAIPTYKRYTQVYEKS